MPAGLIVLLLKWVSAQVQWNLEDILTIAHFNTYAFGLSSANDDATNWCNFHSATFLSVYLHDLHIPQFTGDPLMSQLLENRIYY